MFWNRKCEETIKFQGVTLHCKLKRNHHGSHESVSGVSWIIDTDCGCIKFDAP